MGGAGLREVQGWGRVASVGTHSQFKGLIKQGVKVLLVLLGLPRGQLRELVPGLQGQLDKGIAGTWQVERSPGEVTLPRISQLPASSSQPLRLCPAQQHCPLLATGRKCTQRSLSGPQTCQGRGGPREGGDRRGERPVGSLHSPLESRGSRLEALSSSTRSFCSEAR